MSWLLISSIVLLSSRHLVAAIAKGVASSSLTGGHAGRRPSFGAESSMGAPFLNALATIMSVT